MAADEIESIKFYNDTESADLGVINADISLNLGLGGTKFSMTLSPLAEISMGDIILVQENDGAPSWTLTGGIVTKLEQVFMGGGYMKRAFCRGISYLINHKRLDNVQYGGDIEVQITAMLNAHFSTDHVIGLNAIEDSTENIGAYPGRERAGDFVRDMMKLTSFKIMEAWNATCKLNWASFGGGATSKRLYLYGKRKAGRLASLQNTGGGKIINYVRIEGQRELPVDRETWSPAGAEGSFTLAAIPYGPMRVSWKTGAAVVAETLLTGGTQADGSSVDYYLDREGKTVHFTGHVVVGGGNVYYFEYATRVLLLHEAKDEDSITAHGEHYQSVKDIVVKQDVDIELYANRFLELMAWPERFAAVYAAFKHEYIPNSPYTLLMKALKLSDPFVITNVDISYPSHQAHIRFGEVRPSFQEFLAQMSQDITRLDSAEDTIVTQVDRKTSRNRLSALVTETSRVTFTLNGADYFDHHWRKQGDDKLLLWGR